MLDDPERLLNIRKVTDYAEWRSKAVAKEPWTYEWLKDFDHSTVLWNIGACVGSYALMAGARGARVYAFEPMPVNYHALQDHVELNGLQENVFCMPIGLGSHNRWADFYTHEDGLNLPGYGLASTEGRSELVRGIKLPLMSGDALSESMILPPTHILMDVEGAELHVLEGMQKIFESKKVQSILMEIESEQSEERVNNFMYPHGYYGEEVARRRVNSKVRVIVYEQES